MAAQEVAEATVPPPDAGKAATADPADRSASEQQIRRTFRRIELNSLLRFSVWFYLALAGTWILAAIMLYLVAQQAGIVGNLQNLMREIGWPEFVMNPFTVLRGALFSGLLFAGLATGTTMLAAYLYNLISDLTGGVEMIVNEKDAD